MESPTEWQDPLERPTIGRDEVHVWRLSLSQPESIIRKLVQILHEKEIERADRFYFREHRERFIVGRAMLRLILGVYLDAEAPDVSFEYSEYGKPFLGGRHSSTEVSFNLAHSRELAVYGLTLQRQIGVDVEYIRADMASDEISRRFFSKSEVEAISALPPSSRIEAFFNCWTRKEAYIKARGEGLSFPLNAFAVSLAPGEPATLLSVNDSPEEGSRWSLREISPGPGYAAAVAVEGHELKLRFWEGDRFLGRLFGSASAKGSTDL